MIWSIAQLCYLCLIIYFIFYNEINYQSCLGHSAYLSQLKQRHSNLHFLVYLFAPQRALSITSFKPWCMSCCAEWAAWTGRSQLGQLGCGAGDVCRRLGRRNYYKTEGAFGSRRAASLVYSGRKLVWVDLSGYCVSLICSVGVYHGRVPCLKLLWFHTNQQRILACCQD